MTLDQICDGWYPEHSGVSGDLERWTRIDGAVVKFDQRSPHPNPLNPRSLMWTAWEPDPSERYLRRESKRGMGYPRRFKTAISAMEAVNKLFPLESE